MITIEEKYRVHKVLYHEIEDKYPELYEEIFNEVADTRQVPNYVYLSYLGEECVAMITAYIHNTDTVYMQIGGVKGKYRGYRTLDIFRQLLDLIHEDFPNIICRVLNTHTSALKLMLGVGMIIIGIRLDGSLLYVEFMKIKEE